MEKFLEWPRLPWPYSIGSDDLIRADEEWTGYGWVPVPLTELPEPIWAQAVDGLAQLKARVGAKYGPLGVWKVTNPGARRW